MIFPPTYIAAAEELSRRILALIPGHPEILSMRSPWGLFKVSGFYCKDLDPSMAMAQAALEDAQQQYVARTRLN